MAKYLCIKNLITSTGHKVEATEGFVYESDGRCFTNNSGYSGHMMGADDMKEYFAEILDKKFTSPNNQSGVITFECSRTTVHCVMQDGYKCTLGDDRCTYAVKA